MNKKELAEVEALKMALALAKALSWPTYAPVPLNISETAGEYDKPTPAWWFNTYSARIEQGCFSRNFHSLSNTKKTDSQRPSAPSPWYATRLDALQAMRLAVTRECAEKLAKIDRQIEDEVE